MKKLKLLAMSLCIAASLGTIASASEYGGYNHTSTTSKGYSVTYKGEVNMLSFYAGTYMNQSADLITVGIYKLDGTNLAYGKGEGKGSATCSKTVANEPFNFNVIHKVTSVTYGNFYETVNVYRN